MSVFRKQQALTLEEQHAQAAQRASAALSIFHSVADDLSGAAQSHLDVADEAQVNVDHHVALRDAAQAAAEQAVRQAEAVRSLLG